MKKTEMPREMTREELIAFAMKRIDAKLNHFVREGRIRECDADDARQDAIVAVLEKFKEYDENREVLEKPVVNMLVKIAFKSYFATQRYQKRKNYSDIDSLPESDEPVVNEDVIGELTDLDRIYLKLDLETIREQLSEKQKAVFDLMADHSIPVMARMLDVSLGTIANRIEEIRQIATTLME